MTFCGDIFSWRGPAPFYFVALPEAQSQMIKDVAKLVTYGWGVIPVRAQIGATAFKTSLFPKDGRYLLPLKKSVREAEALKEGDSVSVEVSVGA